VRCTESIGRYSDRKSISSRANAFGRGLPRPRIANPLDAVSDFTLPPDNAHSQLQTVCVITAV